MTLDEKERLLKMCAIEKLLKKKGYNVIAGIDEVGRGPLAGPVVAAACILPLGLLIENLNDSKQLTSNLREKIYNKIVNHPDVIFSVGIISEEVIDNINILEASLLAMKHAVEKLSVRPDYLIFDGKQLPKIAIPSMGIVKGDALSASIAAASIIAKETRDRIMSEYHKEWPEYNFNEHKGYGTAKHKQALSLYGPCRIHRKSFEPIQALLKPGQ